MSESAEQQMLFQWASLYKDKRLKLMFAIPNGGDRHPAVGARMKKEGVRKGVPDIFLPIPNSKYNGLFIEFKPSRKVGKRGKLLKGKPTSNEQEEWIQELNKQGYLALVCYGFEEAKNTIVSYITNH